MIYETNHLWTAEIKWKWRNDRRSERNLCNCVKKPEKKFTTEFFFSGFFRQLHKLCSLRRSFLHFHFISAVHIWFISYIINTDFFHGNIWTHNWPAPNVRGFIAQLVEHRTGIARSPVQTPLKSWIFFRLLLRNCINCIYCDDHFFIFISFTQFIYDLFHISLAKQGQMDNGQISRYLL